MKHCSNVALPAAFLLGATGLSITLSLLPLERLIQGFLAALVVGWICAWGSRPKKTV